MLYLAIALLVSLSGTFYVSRQWVGLPFAGMLLMSVTSVLAIVNCLLLIKTKDVA